MWSARCRPAAPAPPRRPVWIRSLSTAACTPRWSPGGDAGCGTRAGLMRAACTVSLPGWPRARPHGAGSRTGTASCTTSPRGRLRSTTRSGRWSMPDLAYHFKPIGLWTDPLPPAAERKRSPFKVHYEQTLDLLFREARMLDAKHLIMQVDLQPQD